MTACIEKPYYNKSKLMNYGCEGEIEQLYVLH